MLYRRVQILVILSNNCFQAYLWPAIQFYSGMGLISFLYISILFEQQLGKSGIAIVFMVIIGAAATCTFMLGLGSRTLKHSTKILQYYKSWNEHPWTRKFFRSCRPIAICVGGFHKMDSERVPSFIRFVLQRTFFLVLRTKLKFGCGVDMNITF